MDYLPTRDEEECSTNQKNREGRTRSGNLREQVVHENMWPTPKERDYKGAEGKRVIKTSTGYSKVRKKTKTKFGASLNDAVEYEDQKMYPTPTSRDWRDTGNLQNTEQRKDGRIRNDSLPRVISQEIFPTPNAWDAQRGPQKKETLRDKNHQVNLIDAVTHTTPDHLKKDGGSLNPQWVAWLMGYPTEYLNSVPWETRSSRKSSKKSD
jgi:hypothetical protein